MSLGRAIFRLAVSVILMAICPIATVLAAVFVSPTVALMIFCITLPLLLTTLLRLSRFKAENGFWFFKQKAPAALLKTAEGYECGFCGARFSSKTGSCLSCGKNFK